MKTLSIRAGTIFYLTLNEEGTALAQEPIELFRSENRTSLHVEFKILTGKLLSQIVSKF